MKMRNAICGLILSLAATDVLADCPYASPVNWYYSVQDQSPGTQVFNSTTGAYVALADAGYVAWLALGCTVTSIDTQASMYASFTSYAAGISRSRFQAFNSGADLTLTNPLPLVVSVLTIGAGGKVILPIMNTPTSWPIGYPGITIINATGGSDFGVYLADGTTQISTIADGATGIELLEANTDNNGTWAAFVLPSTNPTNATNLTSGTINDARLPTVPISKGGTGVTTGAGAWVTAAATVDFSAAADYTIAVPLPTGYTRIGTVQILISDASADISAATFGLFTATGGGGDALIAAGAAITVTSASDNTNNNFQLINITNVSTVSFAPVANSLYFRVGSTAAAGRTGKVQIVYRPVP